MTTSTTLLRLLALVHEYVREPAPADSDAAAQRDLEYFDRLLQLLKQLDEAGAARLVRGRATPNGVEGVYRARWEIDVCAEGPLQAARKARQAQLRPRSLATVFEVLRHDGAAGKLEWSRAETIDLAEHGPWSDRQALDEIARVLRAPEWRGADDLEYIAEWSSLGFVDT